MKRALLSLGKTLLVTVTCSKINPAAICRPNGRESRFRSIAKADRIVAEVNNGGDMVEATIRMVDPNVSYAAVRATRGKVVRAEPVAALYEQSKIHHVGSFRDAARPCAGSPAISIGPRQVFRRDETKPPYPRLYPRADETGGTSTRL